MDLKHPATRCFEPPTVAFKNTLAFLVIIVILLVRPEGLLGKEFKERV